MSTFQPQRIIARNPDAGRYEGLLPDGRTLISVGAPLFEEIAAKAAGSPLISALAHFGAGWQYMLSVHPDEDITVSCLPSLGDAALGDTRRQLFADGGAHPVPTGIRS